MKTLVEAALKAAEDTAVVLTHGVRDSAVSHGWDDGIVSNMAVSYSNNSYSVDIHPEVEPLAMDKEFGTETSRPTAAIRKYGNDLSKAEQAFIRSLELQLGETL